jgi:hypothetical protein
MNDERGSWYLLTAVIMGIGLGLIYAWVVSPAEFVDTHPSSLRADYKDQYRAMIASAYIATGDIQRAQARLNLLGDDDPAMLAAQAQRFMAEGGSQAEAQALAELASALGQAPTPLPTEPDDTLTPTATVTPTKSPQPTETLAPTSTSTPEIEITETAALTTTLIGTIDPSQEPTITRTQLPTRTATGTSTPLPTSTNTPTLAPPFVLENQVLVCNPAIGESQLQVFVSNTAGVGVPSVEIVVTWADGEEHFFTGLKPDIDTGYADFVMTPGVNYTMQVGDGGQLIPNLSSPECTDNNNTTYWGSWRFIFSHP